MRALVVYESMFGNTEAIARAVAEGLAGHLDVELHEVGDAPAPITELLDLVVVGGPTHAFSMSRPESRTEAHARGATHGGTAYGIREWLGQLARGPHSEPVATFDTRVTRARRLPGSAARKAAKVVRKTGYPAAAGPESFYVDDVAGPVSAGELDRARAWGDRLGAETAARHDGRTGTAGGRS